jgi:hypothetical protein
VLVLRITPIERIFPGHLGNNLGTKGTPFGEQQDIHYYAANLSGTGARLAESNHGEVLGTRHGDSSFGHVAGSISTGDEGRCTGRRAIEDLSVTGAIE